MSRFKDLRWWGLSNTQLMKVFHGGVLIMSGSNCAAGLCSMPVRYLFLDEVDGYSFDADGDVDSISLMVQRTATFINSMVYLDLIKKVDKEFTRTLKRDIYFNSARKASAIARWKMQRRPLTRMHTGKNKTLPVEV